MKKLIWLALAITLGFLSCGHIPQKSRLEYVGSTLWTKLHDVKIEGNYAYCAFKNGFAVFENRNPKKHYGADGQERAMKYKRSNYKYTRANNRYSIWNSRKRSSQGQVGFKI